MYFEARKEQTIPDSWSPSVPRGPKRTDKKNRQYQTAGVLCSVLRGSRRTDKKNRQYQTAGVLVYFEAQKEQTIPDSWSPSVPWGLKRTDKKNRQYQTAGVLVYFEARKEQTKITDNTRQLESWCTSRPEKEQTNRTDNTRQLES